MGILDVPPAVITGGGIRFQGRDMLTMDADEQRQIRGPGISMIFQDALSSLNPVYSVGFQIGEMFRVHRAAPQGVQAARRRADGPRPDPRGAGGSTTTRTSSPAACASAS